MPVPADTLLSDEMAATMKGRQARLSMNLHGSEIALLGTVVDVWQHEDGGIFVTVEEP